MNVAYAIQHATVVIGLANVILVVEAISLIQSQKFAKDVLVDVSAVLILSIVDAVPLDTGQMNMFASSVLLNVLFAGQLLIVIHVFVDGILINAAVVLLQLFLANNVMQNVLDVMACMIAWYVEVATSLAKEIVLIAVHSVPFVKMRIFAQFVIKDIS